MSGDNDTGGDRVRKRARAAAALTLLATASAFLVSSSSDAVRSFRRLSAARSFPRLAAAGLAVVGSEVRLDPSLNDITVKMYVKASGNEPYLGHSLSIADTWGNDVVELTGGRSSLTFLIDNVNYEAVEEMARTHPRQTVRHVNGTDNQGEYKVGDKWEEATKAQRTKLRAVFKDAFSVSAKEDKVAAENSDIGKGDFDWLCYMDDDMVVNVPRLWLELHEVRESSDERGESCSPNCWIADTILWKGATPYAAGGWCMERSVAWRIHALLRSKTDEDLRWHAGNDDVHFVGMLNKVSENGAPWHPTTLGLVPQNSQGWYSHDSRPIDVRATWPVKFLDKDGKVVKKIEKASRDALPGNQYHNTETYPMLEKAYEREKDFIDGWLPTVSVFHNRVNYSAYEIMRGKTMTETKTATD